MRDGHRRGRGGSGRLVEHVLELLVDLLEGGPMGRLPLPAAAHELVDARRAHVGTLHAIAGVEQVVDVGELDARIGRLAQRAHLPQEHAEGPHVRL